MYALVQYDDRSTDEFKNLIYQNKVYAKSFNIDYFFFNQGYEEYPPYWRKVFLVEELLNTYEAVIWVDTDALIVGKFHFKDLFEGGHFVLSPNPPMFDHQSLSMFSAPFCAGVWAVKNSPEGKFIMKTWADSYNCDLWKQDNGKWIHKTGLYGGIAYEQGAFEINIWRNIDFQKWIQNKESRILNYLPLAKGKLKGKSCPADIFAIHYWSGNRTHIKKHFP
jgi:hypothetical protein